jgi:uncharacterized membrane protein
MTLYLLCVWLHIVAATVWVGSMVFFAAAVVPAIRRPELREQAPTIVHLIGGGFRLVGVPSLVVLIVTGILNLHFRGIGWSLLASDDFWMTTAFGRALAWKLGLVTLVTIGTIAHDFLTDNRRVASVLGRLLLLASLAILFFAVALVRGGL